MSDDYTPTTSQIRLRWVGQDTNPVAKSGLDDEFRRWFKGELAKAWDAAATHAYQYGAMSLIEAPNPYRTEIPNA